MKSFVFYTIYSDKYWYTWPKAVASFKYFHPEIPHVIFNQHDIDQIQREYPKAKMGWWYVYLGRKLKDQYDVVVGLDADSVVLDRLTEVFNWDYDIGGTYNNNPHEQFGAWLPEIDPTLDPKIYVNAGFHAIAKKEIWDEWLELCQQYADDPRAHWGEQDMLNIIFHSRGHNSVIFDGERSDYGLPERYYGLAARLQWHLFRVENEKIILNDRVVKLFHEAGGDKTDKLQLEKMFSPEVCKRMNEIIDKGGVWLK